jgi:hypothetical protein
MIRCVVSGIEHPPFGLDWNTSREDHDEVSDGVRNNESYGDPDSPLEPRSAHTIDESAVEKEDGNLDKAGAPEKQHFDDPGVLIPRFVSYQDMQRPE